MMDAMLLDFFLFFVQFILYFKYNLVSIDLANSCNTWWKKLVFKYLFGYILNMDFNGISINTLLMYLDFMRDIWSFNEKLNVMIPKYDEKKTFNVKSI